MSWQADEVARLRAALPAGSTVEPYGSAVSGEVDGWSDLDAEIRVSGVDVELGAVLDGELWAWTIADDGPAQVVRVVLRDARRLDLRVTGARVRTPPEPADRAVRFDLALAASRLGRGDRLIGLHLLLGVAREALVTAMLLRDRQTGTEHHVRGGERDRDAEELLASLTREALGPATASRVANIYGRWRAELEPGYAADWSGLDAVIARGRQGSVPR